jgi:predicted double-glycine peptidase
MAAMPPAKRAGTEEARLSISRWLAGVAWSIVATCLTVWASETLIPYRDLRYEEVVGQAAWYPCGPAAVATLLTFYYGLLTSEAEALELA